MTLFSFTVLFILCLSGRITAGPVISQRIRQSTAPRALYFQSNQVANSIVALPISSNETVMQGTTTSTRGAGANSINSMTMEPAGPDALASQGAVTVVDNVRRPIPTMQNCRTDDSSPQMLFAVNAGSDSLSMFEIDRKDPTCLTLIGKPMATGGKFPVSVAVSRKMNVACVGHSGTVAGISCARFSTQGGLESFDPIRAFDLGQSDPPLGPLNTVSQTFFTDDEKTLITMVKGDPSVNKTGFISTFSTIGGKVSTQGAQIPPKGTGVLFGTKQIPGTSTMLVTDASFGYILSSVNDLAAPLARTAIDGQMATCWATISSKTRTGVSLPSLFSYFMRVKIGSSCLS